MAKTVIVWRERALADIARLHHFLFEKNPDAAQHAAQVIARGSKLLESSPRLGRSIPDGTHRRELFMPFGVGFYVLRYFIVDNTVVIIRVWHSREDRSDSIKRL